MMFPNRKYIIKQLIEQGYGENEKKVIDYLLVRTIDDLVRAKVINPKGEKP